MPMDSLILLFYFEIIMISPWLKMIMKFDFPKHLRIILFYTVLLHGHTFSVAEKNVEIGLSETPKNSLVLRAFGKPCVVFIYIQRFQTHSLT